MKGERLQSLSDICTKPLPSLSVISCLFPETEKRKGRECERKRERRQRDTEREERKAKPSCCEFCHLLKKKKNLHRLALLGGLRRADLLQWSMGLTVEDITMSLIETLLQGLLWGSCFVNHTHPRSGLFFQDVVHGGTLLAFTSPVSHSHITLNKETTNNGKQFSASCTFK